MIDKIINNTVLVLIARIVIALMFIIVGVGKIAHPEEFAREISNYQLLPILFINPLAIILPWLEVITGMMILFGIQIRANAFIVSLMLITFTTAIIIAVAKGLSIDCGCYSQIAAQKVGLPKILENTGLIILSLILVFTENNKLQLKNNYEFNN